ncbi:MAG: glycosyltransferase family 2 protein [Lachnospiraceae bacterium]|nr:glycosyltransferase family 2 protein [Lachnospiraceae bacterium]
MKLAIVVIGYNRVNSFSRLMNSILRAEYCGDIVDLIISIDNSGKDDVENVAKSINWDHGEKRIITFEERQGLKKHILGCGKYLDEYDAIAVLEDDIAVSPAFYQYMKESVAFYKDSSEIAGISLYGYAINENNKYPFRADYSEYDTYFIQFASSWGQIWMKSQWKEFYNWYLTNDEKFGDTESIPYFVTTWPDTSWKRYHIKYCIEKDKYFAYPYMALSTCFSEDGQNTNEASIILQTQLLYEFKSNYHFAPFDSNSCAKYDAFFERVLPENRNLCGIPFGEICMDLYGYGRTQNKRYVISPQELGFKVCASFGAVLEPQERNVLQGITGNVFFLYDTQTESKFSKKEGLEFTYRYHVFTNRKTLIKEWAKKKVFCKLRKWKKR